MLRLRGRRALVFGILVAVGAAALLPRVLDLGAFLSPDEERWRLNTIGFAEGLRTGDLQALYQQPHPGITNMWLTWATIEKPTWAQRKLPLVVGIALLIVVATLFAVRLWGWRIGAAVGFLQALHPYFIGHSRVLAMDALLSIFLVLALLAILLWVEEQRSRWAVLSGVFGGLAVLSKLAGAVIFPFVAALLIWLVLRRSLAPARAFRALALWMAGAFGATMLLFPTLLVHPEVVLRGAREFVSAEHFQHPAHALGPRWYPEALLIFTTPFQLLALVGLLALPRAAARLRRHLAILGAFALLFFLAMQFSAKKGDRYLLPDFVLFDVLAVLLLAVLLGAFRAPPRTLLRRFVLLPIAAAVGWQAWNVITLHPYTHAYRNPFFRSVALHRPMGWGEGLDLAAEYLNAKSGSENSLVASYYEGPFAYRFRGQVTSAERLAKESLEDVGADYVVLYRTMVGRGPQRWETKVLAQFRDRTPEKTISLNGEEYVWIYKVQSAK